MFFFLEPHPSSNLMFFFLLIFSNEISINVPGLALSSFLNDLICEIILITFSTSLKSLSFLEFPEIQLEKLQKFLKVEKTYLKCRLVN